MADIDQPGTGKPRQQRGTDGVRLHHGIISSLRTTGLAGDKFRRHRSRLTGLEQKTPTSTGLMEAEAACSLRHACLSLAR
jgi:hypothetical protein